MVPWASICALASGPANVQVGLNQGRPPLACGPKWLWYLYPAGPKQGCEVAGFIDALPSLLATFPFLALSPCVYSLSLWRPPQYIHSLSELWETPFRHYLLCSAQSRSRLFRHCWTFRPTLLAQAHLPSDRSTQKDAGRETLLASQAAPSLPLE